MSFKGSHGFEGTEAYYGPFELIHANNLANTTGQTGAFDIDTEQVLAWDPDVIFVDFNGMSLIKDDYAANSAFYNSLTAVKEGKVILRFPSVIVLPIWTPLWQMLITLRRFCTPSSLPT